MKALSEFSVNVIRVLLETRIEELNKLKAKYESDADETKQDTKKLCAVLIRDMNFALDELNSLE